MLMRFSILPLTFAALLSFSFLTSIFSEVISIDTAYAATSQTNPGGTQGTSQTNPGGGGVGELTNPLKYKSIIDFLMAVIEVILIFAVPIIVFFIMYAGFLYVTARGDTSQISKAHMALTWSVIGGVIVLGAFVIMEVIRGTVEGFRL